VEGDKTMREGENISFRSPELISDPEIVTVKRSPSLILPLVSNVKANDTTETSFTITLFNLMVKGRQHFVTTDTFVRSIESIDMGTKVEEREVQ
jgi:hypothetical protein